MTPKEAKTAVDKEVGEWEQQERTVTLTNDEWNTITCFILMSTNYRKGEQEAWERLSEEKKEDGTPRFIHAASNAHFWRETSEKLEKIRDKIYGRGNHDT